MILGIKNFAIKKCLYSYSALYKGQSKDYHEEYNYNHITSEERPMLKHK